MVLANTLVSVEPEVTADDGNHATKTGLVSHRVRWVERTNQAATAMARLEKVRPARWRFHLAHRHT
jgi:hypothetical protein